MTLQTRHSQQLEELAEILSLDKAEVLRHGLITALTERVWHLKERLRGLTTRYGSLKKLEHRIRAEGVSPDNHSRYHDLLEWLLQEPLTPIKILGGTLILTGIYLALRTPARASV